MQASAQPDRATRCTGSRASSWIRSLYAAAMEALVLFTRDLRVHDHPALAEACRLAEDVVPLFVLDPGLSGASPNRTRFLVECLVDLDRNLRRRGSGLFVRRGDPAAEAVRLAVETGRDAIFLTRDVGSYGTARLTRLRSLGATAGSRCGSSRGTRSWGRAT